MTTSRRIACVVVAVVALAARAAADPAPADPKPAAPELTHYVHFKSPLHVETQGGAKIDLPPGYYVDAPTWKNHDDGDRDRQNQITRLTAENKSFRDTASSWQPGWKTLLATFVIGVSVGVYAHEKL